MSAIDECGEYPTVQPGAVPSEEMEVRIVSLEDERLKRRLESQKVPVQTWDPSGLERLLADVQSAAEVEAIMTALGRHLIHGPGAK